METRATFSRKVEELSLETSPKVDLSEWNACMSSQMKRLTNW